ncbi:MAG: hypothetical protein ACEY3H_02255 [Wolbachia sp.]
MRDLYSKTNAPYLIAGTLATLTLLASGVFAIAPYVAFLSSIAAFNVALPVALSLSILSTLILALSCKMISNNKKIEVEKNKFAEKEQELKQQFESKVQELENEITLGKEAASKEVEELNNQLNELTREKQDLESKVKKSNDEKERLEAELKTETEKAEQSERKLAQEKKNLEYKDEAVKKQLQEQQVTTQQELNQKIEELANVKQQFESKVQGLESKIAQEKKAKENVGREAKGLNNQLSGLTQEKQDLEGKIEELYKKIKSLNEQLNGAQQTLAKKKQELEQEREDFHFELEEMKNNHKTDMDKFKKQAEERLKDKEISVLNVVKEKVEQGLSGSEEQQYMQDTDHIQEAVNKFMQPIYEELDINNQLDISSEHLSELEGIGENESVNKQFPKPKLPYTSTPRRYSRKSLSPKKEDEDENKEDSGLQNQKSPNASFSSTNSSPLKDTINNFYTH